MSELVIYKMFKNEVIDKDMDINSESVDQCKSRRLSIGFSRVSHNFSSRSHIDEAVIDCQIKDNHSKSLSIFSNVGGYSGVFLSGPKPALIMSSDIELGICSVHLYSSDEVLPSVGSKGHSSIHIHPMQLDGHVRCLSQFNNQNCSNGFIYLNAQNSLRFCLLPTHFEYESDWPCAKVPFQETPPQKCTFHHTSDTFAVACSNEVPFILAKAQYAAGLSSNVIDADDVSAIPILQPNSKNYKPLYLLSLNLTQAPGTYYPITDDYSVLLVSPITWEVVDRFDLEEYEQILAISVVELSSKESQSGMKLFLAVGTGYSRGEDLSTRGRV